MKRAYVFLLVGALAVALLGGVRGWRNYRLTRDTDSSSTVLPESASREDVEILDGLASAYRANCEDCGAALHYASKSYELAPDTTRLFKAKLSAAGCYRKQGDESQARKLYQEVRNRASEPYFKSKAMYALGKMEGDTEESLREVVAKYPETEVAYAAVGQIAERRAPTSRRAVTEELMSMAEEFAQAGEERQAAASLYRCAHLYRQQGKEKDCMDVWEAIARDYPESAWAAQAQQDIVAHYYAHRQWGKVIQVTQEIIDKYPDQEFILPAHTASLTGFAQMEMGVARQFLAIEKKYPR